MKTYKSTKDIKVGAIGYGKAFGMGGAHLNEMERAGMTPVCVVEKDSERLEFAKKERPLIETYNTVEEMLEKSDVDLLAIITPHNTHAELALKCLNGGKHVVCEKPLAITTEECDAMINAAIKHDVLLSTYHNRHWDGCITHAMKQIVNEKVIGDIVRIEAHMGNYEKPGDWWRSSKSISGGILYDWGVHLLEYSLQLMNDNITEVSAYAKQGYWAPQTPFKDDTNEDEAFVVIRFESGRWVTLTMSSLDMNMKKSWLEITGTKGTYLFDYNTYTIFNIEDNKKIQITGKNPPSDGWKFYQNIADHLTKGEHLVITPEWARRPIHILDLAGQSYTSGKSIAVKYQ